MTGRGKVGKVDFGLGDRVRLSELGRRKSRYPDKQGTIVGISKTGSAYRVRWADLKTADYVHWSLLQACEELANPVQMGPRRYAPRRHESDAAVEVTATSGQ
jgi:hypothetical protein